MITLQRNPLADILITTIKEIRCLKKCVDLLSKPAQNQANEKTMGES
jgi:hypothetical protein